MNFNPHKIIAGAVSGFVAAFLVDLHSWSADTSAKFDVLLALKRWVAGAVSGAVTALGLASV